ncbi:hypothetical protein SPFL3102_03551 [Sporomusaceae bacterium FL31]|nr:hypothetical protein SPFL3101_00454 [Sporomusaceae bacterium FL31]GCE35700.1 hypothetical protein SPFL3102_03551 [Sporomusaceae bacterium]
MIISLTESYLLEHYKVYSVDLQRGVIITQEADKWFGVWTRQEDGLYLYTGRFHK